MRILALVKSLEHVCCRYRIRAFQPGLEAAGHEVAIRAWPRSWLARVQLLRQLGGFDALILQRRLLPTWQLSLIRRRVRWLIYDFDDSVFLNSSYNPSGHASPSRSKHFDAMVRRCDAVVAGNDYLRRQACQHASPGRVHVIPTCVDAQAYPVRQHEDRAVVQMVWIGSSSTLRGLERLAPVLANLGERFPKLRLKIICDKTLALGKLPVDFIPWSESREAEELATADLGISWIPDDAWSAGKCGLKVLQYMATGLPVVANPVGVHPAMVRHRHSGFLVKTEEDWRDALAQLVANAELRQRMGQAGRQLLLRDYDLSVGRAAWAKLVGQLEATAPAARSA